MWKTCTTKVQDTDIKENWNGYQKMENPPTLMECIELIFWKWPPNWKQFPINSNEILHRNLKKS